MNQELRDRMAQRLMESEDAIFEIQVNASKAQAFDYIAKAMAELKTENDRLKKIIDTHLEDCDECEGKGFYDSNLKVGEEGMRLEMDAPCICAACKGTGKQPK